MIYHSCFEIYIYTKYWKWNNKNTFQYNYVAYLCKYCIFFFKKCDHCSKIKLNHHFLKHINNFYFFLFISTYEYDFWFCVLNSVVRLILLSFKYPKTKLMIVRVSWVIVRVSGSCVYIDNNDVVTLLKHISKNNCKKTACICGLFFCATVY